MLSRVKFRLVLPCAVIAIMMCLFAVSVATMKPREAARSALTEQTNSEAISFEPTFYKKTSLVFKGATAVDFPAIACGVVVAIPLFAAGVQGGDVLWTGLGALFTPLIWWPLGRWVDEQIAGRFIAPRKKSRLREFFRILLRFLAGIYLLGGIMIALPSNHHRTEESNFMSAVLIVWCGGYLLCSFLGAWRIRRESLIAPAAPIAHL